MIEFFLRRPHFAAVMSFIVLLAGLITIPALPVAQYPQISPPTVTVTSQYPGATAAMVMRSVTTPLEININGSDGLQYMQSYSSANGTSAITCTFALGTDPTTDQTNVQHGVDLTLSQLPQAVQSEGVSVQKSSGNITIAVAMLSTSSAVSDVAVSNYADLNVIENLKRVAGVGQVEVLGDRTYGMRIWVDPHKLQANNVSIDTVLNAIKQNNADVAPGAIGQPPTTGSQPFQIPISINGRLQSPEEFKQIVVAAQPNGGYLRLGDVAHVELGAQNYITSARYNGQTAVVLAVIGEPTANSLQISKNVRQTMAQIAQTMPAGYAYKIAFDTSDFVRASIKEVLVTLLIAILLVVLVIFIFLQSWHSTIIPSITIPVSLIGTFAAMKLLGFSINTLTLFGLTLATGLVVDDAIVVLENIVRHIVDDKSSPFEATVRAMREIGGAVVATSLVLMSVFIPVAFLPGTTGLLFQQFALTMAASIGISLFTAMTLAPVLTYLLVHGAEPTHNRFMLWFNDRLVAFTNWYRALVPRLIARQKTRDSDFRRRNRAARPHVQDHADRLSSQRRSESALRTRDASDSGLDRPNHRRRKKTRKHNAQDAAGGGGNLRHRFWFRQQQLESGHDVPAAQTALRAARRHQLVARRAVRSLPAVFEDSQHDGLPRKPTGDSRLGFDRRVLDRNPRHQQSRSADAQ